MALQVWLPLNGNLKNKGCADIDVTNTGATIDNNGKIGQCYSFNGSSNYLYSNYNFYNQTYTFSAWIYTTSSGNQNICCCRTSVGCGFSVFLLSGKMRIDSGGNALQWTTNFTYPVNTWFHLTVTYDGTSTSYYINGEFREKREQILNSSYWGNITSFGASQENGTGYNYFLNGRLNDIRIYDHCLSVVEVKEISRGLVVHYKLDDPLIGVVFYDYLQSTGTQWIDTGVKGYMNHTYEVDFQQTDTGNYRIWGVLGQSSYIGYNMSLTYGGGWLVRWNSTANDQNYITLSAIDSNRHVFKITNGQCYLDNVNKGISSGHNAEFSIDNNLFLFTINPADTAPSSNSKCKIYSYKDIDSNGKLIRNMVPCTYNGIAGMWDKVENKFYGNSGTGTFTLGSQLSTTSNIVDCSGYGNRGYITSGTLEIEQNTRRYLNSLYISDNVVIQHNNVLLNNSDQEWTCCAWINPTTVVNNSLLNNFNEGNRIKHGTYPLLYVNSGTNDYYNYGNKQIVANEWQYIVFVFKNGTISGQGAASDAIKRIYINGIDQTSPNGPNKTCTPLGIPDIVTLFGGGYVGLVSDYREYATALSAEDIKQLYEVSAKIDNLGNLHSYEFNEDDSNSIKKTGVSNFNFKEQSTNAKIYKQINPNLLQGTEIDTYRYERVSGMGTEFGKRFVPTEQLQTGTNYTFSAMIRGSANMNIYTLNTGGNMSFKYVDKSDMDENEFKLFSVTFKVSGNRTINEIYPCSMYGKSNTLIGDWYEIKANSIKLEEGTICTPWIPSETDNDYRIYNGMFEANQFIEI